MKRVISVVLVVMLLISCAVTASAADTSREFFFELTVDGGSEKKVRTGDIITVSFTLHRTDSEEAYDMYAMQNEIRYDSESFKLVEGSAMLSDGISTTEIGLRDSFREFYMNFVSLSGGESWDAKRLIGSFQLEVIGTSGVTKITNQDYLVSTADGKDRYAASCQDVTVILSTDCTVSFESNGGTEVPGRMVQYGETIAKPEDPVREGYHLEGWYSDLDLQNRWDFDNDTVQGNLTLYAKWEEAVAEPVVPVDDDDTGSLLLWVLLAVIVLLLIILLAVLLGPRTVRFDSCGGSPVEKIKIKKGALLPKPMDPVKPGVTFAGWYMDRPCTDLWNFEQHRVQKNIVLYAGWK